MADRSIIFPAPRTSARRLLAFDSPELAEFEWPYFAICGASPGPTLSLIAGIHGAEYPPIDAVIHFCRALDPASLRGRVLGVPVINLPAFWERTPFVCPRDGKNPNRVFPGDPAGSFSEVLAHHVFQTIIKQGDYLVDLHCGDMVEELMSFSLVQESGNVEVDQTATDMAVAFGLPYLVIQKRSGGPIAGTTNAAAAEAGIPAVIAEVGGVGQLRQSDVDTLVGGVTGVMKRLGMLDGRPEAREAPAKIGEFVWMRAQRGGFFRRSVVAGDHLTIGSSIGQIVDLWGELVEEVASPVDGVVLFVTTSPAIADNGLLIGIGVPR